MNNTANGSAAHKGYPWKLSADQIYAAKDQHLIDSDTMFRALRTQGTMKQQDQARRFVADKLNGKNLPVRCPEDY